MALPDNFCIVSGGQTGADRAALDFAIHHGIAHEGWCPQGRIAEDGPIPAKYQLKETKSNRYPQRTKYNIRDTDATLVLTLNSEPSGGTALTLRLAEKLAKPYLHLYREEFPGNASQYLQAFIEEHKIERLNVAGPRASQEPKINEFVQSILTSALNPSPSP